MIKLNLGCGKKYLKGYINTDINKLVKADTYFNLNTFPYPFKSNFADIILLDNVLEHVEDVVSVLEEIHRILKPSGVLEIYLPYGKSDGALQDPTHKHLFTEKSMDYFLEGHEMNYYSKCKYKLLKRKLFNSNKTMLSKFRYLIPIKPVLKYFIFNIYDGLYFKIQPVK